MGVFTPLETPVSVYRDVKELFRYLTYTLLRTTCADTQLCTAT